MPTTFAGRFDALADWRLELDRRVAAFSGYLSEHDLLDAEWKPSVDALRARLAADRMVVAFVAEFSRGKSELINAIFFADTGRRVLPATPGRTTMCPVELAYNPDQPPALSLLPIETRLEDISLADWRHQPDRWQRFMLDPSSPERLAQVLQQVTRTQRVSLEQAKALGFWRDDQPEDNPPVGPDGDVEVPSWRHALINYPHPLLQRGLVVIDTPGLNAIGAEPELTLSLLPSAHATVFLLSADTGVTRSDLSIWRDHLGADASGAGAAERAQSRYVVLNKIDTLTDPLASSTQVREHIESQRQSVADTLDVPLARVFALSARQGLAARIERDEAALAASGLLALESALGAELLPQRGEVLALNVADCAGALQSRAQQRLGDLRHHVTEQLLELQSLRGKSSAKVRMLMGRVEAESQEFEQCAGKLAAVRAVHARMLRETLLGLTSELLREEMAGLQRDIANSLLQLGARKAFIALCGRLRAHLTKAQARAVELHEMLAGSFKQLNTEYGFVLTLPDAPQLVSFNRELDLIEHSYSQYLGLTQALRMSEGRFQDQFRRMLLSKLRVVFENASAEVELWNKSASTMVDAQVRERRRTFKRRHEALQRVQEAAGDLEARIADLEATEAKLSERIQQVNALADQVFLHTQEVPSSPLPPGVDLMLDELPANAQAA